MPTITISEESLAILQRYARPFVDSVDVAIKNMDGLIQNSAAGAASALPAETSVAERRIDPRDLPKLTHTKLLDASIGGASLSRPNWNRLLEETVRRAIRQVRDFDKLRRICPVNMIKGRKNDEGYTHLADIDISVQGQDANGACRGVVTAAQALGLELKIELMWRPKEGANFPGERGRLHIPAAKRTAA
ncbi:T4SS efffector SepA family protein [Peristeroidobacter soli]|uniref:T4SS efffector SepA family protein n=1 Tax=Peristeroidobacter soli TaxID=2497877 RepID=UPI00101E0B91|nr:hypothetical protein [Peristeroidobacter soli]